MAKNTSTFPDFCLVIGIVPPLGTRRDAHKLIKFLYMNVTALPLQYWKRVSLELYTCIHTHTHDTYDWIDYAVTYPSHSVMENSRPRVVIACRLMVILLFESLTAPLIFAGLGLIYVHNLFWWSRSALIIGNAFGKWSCRYIYKIWIHFFGLWTWKRHDILQPKL